MPEVVTGGKMEVYISNIKENKRNHVDRTMPQRSGTLSMDMKEREIKG